MTLPFTEEEIVYLKKLIQRAKDREAWGRLSTHVKTVAMYLMMIGGFFAFIKEPLFRIMGWTG